MSGDPSTARGGDALSRREMLGLVAALPFAVAIEGGPEAFARAADAAGRALADQGATGQTFAPRFFTEHEWATVRVLVDYIIPADSVSGGATDAGVPEFMDFMMMDQPGNQGRMREGLQWMDREAESRFGDSFIGCDDVERRVLLSSIAWPGRAGPAVLDGVRFFNMFRDLTASGFWSSEVGIADLGYLGNQFVEGWSGCPEPALRKLAVSYEEDWDR